MHAPKEGEAAAEIVRRARSRLGESGYDILCNNCEHLCSWAEEGRAQSTQVDALSPLGRLGVRLVEHALAAIAAVGRLRRDRWGGYPGAAKRPSALAMEGFQ